MKFLARFLQCKSPPAALQAIHDATMARITYSDDKRNVYAYVPPGGRGVGDCQIFAFTNMVDLSRAGYDARLRVGHTRSGVPHVYAQCGEWALDNRFKQVIPMREQDCK